MAGETKQDEAREYMMQWLLKYMEKYILPVRQTSWGLKNINVEHSFWWRKWKYVSIEDAKATSNLG